MRELFERLEAVPVSGLLESGKYRKYSKSDMEAFAGKFLPKNAPSKVRAVATVWHNGLYRHAKRLMRDGEIEQSSFDRYLKSRLYVSVNKVDGRAVWTVSDNVESRLIAFRFHVEDDSWYGMYSDGHEFPLRGGHMEALKMAKVVFDGP